MLTIGSAALHVGATVLGALTSALTVTWWQERQKARSKAPVASTAGAFGRSRKQARSAQQRRCKAATAGQRMVATAGQDTGGTLAFDFKAVRKIVEAVPFYGPPAAAALDVVQDVTTQAQGQNKKKKHVRPSKPKPKGNADKEAEPIRLPPKKTDTSEEKAEKTTMIMADQSAEKAGEKAGQKQGTDLETIVSGLAAADEELGAALAPRPPRVDYFIYKGGKRLLDQKKYRRWHKRYAEYLRELGDYNAARAFDKQVGRQKKDIKENIRRAKSNNEVEKLRRDLRHVESMGKLSRKPKLFRNINRDSRLESLVRMVFAGQRPQVTDSNGFEAFIQSMLAAPQGADPAMPFTAPPQAPAVPLAPPVTALPPGTPFVAPPVPGLPQVQPGQEAPFVMPGQVAPQMMPQAQQMAPQVVPVAPAPLPFALPPGQPEVQYVPAAEPQYVEEYDPRLAPMDDYGALQALADGGFGVLELEGTEACECGGTCDKCQEATGCTSCAIGNFDDDDDDLEGGFDDDLEGAFDDLEGGFDDDLEGEDDDDLEGGFDDDLEGEDDDDLEGGFDDDLEGGFEDLEDE